MSYTQNSRCERGARAGSIRYPADRLGTWRQDVTFSDVQEAAAGMFILYPLAPFYALLLESKRVLELVRNEASVVGQLKAMVGALGGAASRSRSKRARVPADALHLKEVDGLYGSTDPLPHQSRSVWPPRHERDSQSPPSGAPARPPSQLRNRTDAASLGGRA